MTTAELLSFMREHSLAGVSGHPGKTRPWARSKPRPIGADQVPIRAPAAGAKSAFWTSKLHKRLHTCAN
jgi:hypothetical protein